MKEIIFKFWKHNFEIKINRIPDDKKIEYLTKALWDELEKSFDLTVCTGTFKQIQLQKFPSDNELSVKIKNESIYDFKTNKY